MKTLTIWHTNDIHSHFDAFLKIGGYLEKHRQEEDLLLDAGDFCDFRSPMINGTGGTGGITLLKAAGYDALAIGNNEFFSGIDAMAAMSSMGLPLLSCNLSDLDGKPIGQILPSLTIKKGEVRCLIIGCSPYWGAEEGDTSFMDMTGIRTVPPGPAVSQEINRHAGQYDLCILLSHTGIRQDRIIASETEGIDLIIGGHSHTEMAEPEKVGDTWIHHSGRYGQYLGRIALTLNDQGNIASLQADNLKSFEEDSPLLRDVLATEEQRGIDILSRCLYDIPELTFDPFAECAAMNVLADALWQEYDGDLAIINNGILEGPLGPRISRLHLLHQAPSGLNPTSVYWHGRQIKEALQCSLTEEWNRRDGRGAGFRGKVLGTLSVSRNVRVEKEPFRVLVNGAEMQDEQLYHVITDDYLQRGSGYPMLGFSQGETYFYPGYIRGLLERILNRKEYLDGAGIKRIYDEEDEK